MRIPLRVARPVCWALCELRLSYSTVRGLDDVTEPDHSARTYQANSNLWVYVGPRHAKRAERKCRELHDDCQVHAIRMSSRRL